MEANCKYLVYVESVCEYGTDRHFNLFDKLEDAQKKLTECYERDKKLEFSDTETETTKTDDEYQIWASGEWVKDHCVGKIIKIIPNIFESAEYSELF